MVSLDSDSTIIVLPVNVLTKICIFFVYSLHTLRHLAPNGRYRLASLFLRATRQSVILRHSRHILRGQIVAREFYRIGRQLSAETETGAFLVVLAERNLQPVERRYYTLDRQTSTFDRDASPVRSGVRTLGPLTLGGTLRLGLAPLPFRTLGTRFSTRTGFEIL